MAGFLSGAGPKRSQWPTGGGAAQQHRRPDMETLLKLDAEQAQGAVAAGLGDSGDGVSGLGPEQSLPGQIEPLAADPLRGGASKSVAKGILEGTPSIVALIRQHGQIERLIEIGLDIENQSFEAVPVVAVRLWPAIDIGLPGWCRAEQHPHQPAELVAEDQPLQQLRLGGMQLTGCVQQGCHHREHDSGDVPLPGANRMGPVRKGRR